MECLINFAKSTNIGYVLTIKRLALSKIKQRIEFTRLQFKTNLIATLYLIKIYGVTIKY